nr:MAG TPA: hypothetical protein [Caudoviricetes sp.]DAR42568.1 MAG TPA: hypothetical protein [Caudoviricetes sp.]
MLLFYLVGSNKNVTFALSNGKEIFDSINLKSLAI